jgi:HK97 family phage prohead protease
VTERHPAYDSLCRSYAFSVRATEDGDADDDGLTLEGYGAVFNAKTRIDSWEGSFDEQVAPGAFKKSLRERTPRLQFDHGHHPLIGSIPIGRIEQIGEDDTGLRVTARLSDNWLVEPIRDAIRDVAVDGMSFRFSVVRDEWHDANGKRLTPTELDALLWDGAGDRGPILRTLREVKVAEVGPVVWPAYEQTSVAVRSMTVDLSRLDEPATRSFLARAVLMADAAEAERDTDAPPPTDGAEGHAEGSDDTPQPTAEAAGEHESPSIESRRRRDRLRAQVQAHRGYLLGITESET